MSGAFSLEESLKSLTSLESLENLFPQSGGSVESLESLEPPFQKTPFSDADCLKRQQEAPCAGHLGNLGTGCTTKQGLSSRTKQLYI